jgi:hypothetical protein
MDSDTASQLKSGSSEYGAPSVLLQKTSNLTLFRPAHIFRMKTKLARPLHVSQLFHNLFFIREYRQLVMATEQHFTYVILINGLGNFQASLAMG